MGASVGEHRGREPMQHGTMGMGMWHGCVRRLSLYYYNTHMLPLLSPLSIM